MTQLRRALCGALLGMVIGSSGPSPASAQSAEELIRSQHVRIRQRLEPAEPVYVGQPVRVWIDVMTRTWFLEAPGFPPTIEVRSAIVVPPEAFGVNSTERIGGESYAVQSRSFTVFPQTTGTFDVPPVSVRLVVARDDASRSPELMLETEPMTIEARLPEGAAGHGLVLSTPRLTVEESYDRSLEGLRVGDSFQRRVALSIQDSVAMLLPPAVFEAPEGIAVYPDRPTVEDRRNRGQLSGERVDTATYLMEAEGTYRLPETRLWWWNLRTSSLEEEVLPAVELRVEANPDLAAEHLGQPDEEAATEQVPVAAEGSGWGLREWATALGLLVVGLLVLRKIGQAFGGGRQDRDRQEDSEEVTFHRFQSAARSGDAAQTYEALLRWLDRFEPVSSPATLRSFVSLAEDEKLTDQCDALEQMLYGGGPGSRGEAWSGGSLAAAVARARKRLGTPHRGWHAPSEALPPMNP